MKDRLYLLKPNFSDKELDRFSAQDVLGWRECYPTTQPFETRSRSIILISRDPALPSFPSLGKNTRAVQGLSLETPRALFLRT